MPPRARARAGMLVAGFRAALSTGSVITRSTSSVDDQGLVSFEDDERPMTRVELLQIVKTDSADAGPFTLIQSSQQRGDGGGSSKEGTVTTAVRRGSTGAGTYKQGRRRRSNR